MSIFSRAKGKVKDFATNVYGGVKIVADKAKSLASSFNNLGKGTSSADTASVFGAIGGIAPQPTPAAPTTIPAGSGAPKSNAQTIREIDSIPSFTPKPNAPGIVPQVYPGSTGPGSNQNVSINSYGGFTPTPSSPTTITSRGASSISPSSTRVASFGGTEQVQAFTPSADNQTFSSINSVALSAPSTQSASISLPSAPAYSNPGAINNAGIASVLSETKQYDPKTGLLTDIPKDPAASEAERRQKEFNDMLGLIPQKDSVLNDADVNRQDEEVRLRKQEVNNYTAQLNNIVAKQQQDLLSTRGTLSAEGSTEAVYGGIAATINREAAIKALPVQAQIAAAQGNLDLAQDYLTDLRKIKQEAIDVDYSYNMKKFDAISGFVTGEQKIRLDKMKDNETRAHQTTTANLSEQSKWAEIAKDNGQSNLISRIYALNPASPTFRQDLAIETSKINSLEAQKKLADINTVDAATKPYANDLEAIIGSTLSTIPTKFGQETFKKQIASARNDADKMNLIAAQVLKGQPNELRLDFANQAAGIASIDKALVLLDEGTKTGVLKNAIQYTYNLSGKDFDPNLAKVNSYITSAIQPYRNSVTGAAWGDQEEAEYASLFGSTKYSPAELKQRLLQTKETLKSKSAIGLNTFVNPLGVYGNQFETGNFAPEGTTKSSPYSVVTSSGKQLDLSIFEN